MSRFDRLTGLLSCRIERALSLSLGFTRGGLSLLEGRLCLLLGTLQLLSGFSKLSLCPLQGLLGFCLSRGEGALSLGSRLLELCVGLLQGFTALSDLFVALFLLNFIEACLHD